MESKAAIEEALERATTMADKPQAFSQTYEEGVKDALDWVLGNVDDPTEQ